MEDTWSTGKLISGRYEVSNVNDTAGFKVILSVENSALSFATMAFSASRAC